MYRVTVQPWNLTFHVKEGILLRDFLLNEGILIDFPCGGKGLCMQCKVIIDPPTDSGKGGKKPLSKEEIDRGTRLACQTVIEKDCTVTIMESSATGIYWEAGETEEEVKPILPGEPAVTRIEISLDKPSINDQRSDVERVKEALVKKGVNKLEHDENLINLSQYESLSRSLRLYNWNIDVALDNDDSGSLLGITGNSHRDIYGFAIDLGTTTIDISLHNLETGGMLSRKTLLNRQTSYGADVISRVESFKKERKAVRNAVLDTVREGCSAILKETGIKPDRIFKSIVVGNPIMLHIFHNIDPYALTEAPYIPVFSGIVRESPSYYGFDFQSWGIVESLPLISAYVGADTVGMILAMSVDKEDIVSLSVDIGTNGEIVLSNRGKLFVTSTAAGPAFEGAQIACGMRAIEGAIYSVDIEDSGTVSYKIIGSGETQPARGICGTGLVSAVSELLRTGILDNTGRLLEPDEIKNEEIRNLAADRIFTVDNQRTFAITEDRRVYITQRDVRELQLAKGAIRTGIESLLGEEGIPLEKINLIRLAGNFGAGMDIDAAIRIGLIPSVKPERVDIVGNAALRGASIVLVSKTARKRVLAIARDAHFIELAGKPEFQMRFAESMLF